MADDNQRVVTLGAIARAVDGELTGDGSADVLDVTHDSRQVSAGALFVAVRGLKIDGVQFVEQALSRGAAGIISEQNAPPDFGGVWIKVNDARRALALSAALVHRHPSRELQLVGITGTNGKTTTAYLVSSLAEAAGETSAMLTTVESQIGPDRQKAERTTPEASETQRFLRRAVAAGCRMAVMECSSQALHLRRCDALRVSIAVFTNLTRDHLDYHHTMENYFAAKLCLFNGTLGEHPRVNVVNMDDPYGANLALDLEGEGRRVVRYGLETGADVTARGIEITLDGTRFELETPAGRRALHSPFVGRPHIYNMLAAAACGLELGFDLETIVRGIEACVGVPGRFERIPHDGDFAVVVDYAHTDDALLNVLSTARDVARGKIITVFGCGGDRDRSKRAPMGEAAGALSDLIILTSDNPRTEDPLGILADAEVGLRVTGKPYQKIPDRREAIHRAIGEARAGDVVIIAGKGHEDYQIIGSEILHFDDREVAREALEERK